MSHIDVFNGDADGILALHQLRLAEPVDSRLVTGVKRDIKLLARVEAGAGDTVTVLDISLEKNRDDLQRILKNGAIVRYFDHHRAGEIPVSERLLVRIDTAADRCTSLIVNDELKGRYLPWAVAAAFGDNLYAVARKLSGPLDLDDAKLSGLEELGTLVNYNGYGVTGEDLFFAPDALYRRIAPYIDPFAFMHEDDAFQLLREGYASDMNHARAVTPEIEEARIAVFMLPDAKWARRVSGVFGNELARENPDRAHALMTTLPDGAYRISVRAPLNNQSGADELCSEFPSGGGRKAAAGINHLPRDLFGAFVDAFRASYGA